jgi:hypothetical protein
LPSWRSPCVHRWLDLDPCRRVQRLIYHPW